MLVAHHGNLHIQLYFIYSHSHFNPGYHRYHWVIAPHNIIMLEWTFVLSLCSLILGTPPCCFVFRLLFSQWEPKVRVCLSQPRTWPVILI
jgi:hypothetical protein